MYIHMYVYIGYLFLCVFMYELYTVCMVYLMHIFWCCKICTRIKYQFKFLKNTVREPRYRLSWYLGIYVLTYVYDLDFCFPIQFKMSDERKLGICVSWGRTGGSLVVPPNNGRARSFSLIWNRSEGLVAFFGHKLEKGQWVHFTLSDQRVRLHFVERKVVDCLWKTNACRQTKVDSVNIQVMAFVQSFQRYNDYYRIGMDQLFGWVLVSEDSFARMMILQENLNAQMSIIFKENCVRGFNWVAIAVNEKRQDGTDCYRKLESLPRFMDDIASIHYASREIQFTTRYQLRNPLPSIFITEYGETPEMRKMLTQEYALGIRYGFCEDYERDINASKMYLNCLVVFKSINSALVYNKKHHVGVVRRSDFPSQEEFDSICRLGNWVVGKFTKPFLVRQFELEYNLMLCEQHRLRQTQPPYGLLTRIRHFREENTKYKPFRRHGNVEKEAEQHEIHETVMVKTAVHFTQEKVKRVKRRICKGRTGVVVSTEWGNVFFDQNAYMHNNFEGKHLSLWVSCPPQRVTTMSHENCFWYFVGDLDNADLVNNRQQSVHNYSD